MLPFPGFWRTDHRAGQCKYPVLAIFKKTYFLFLCWNLWHNFASFIWTNGCWIFNKMQEHIWLKTCIHVGMKLWKGYYHELDTLLIMYGLPLRVLHSYEMLSGYINTCCMYSICDATLHTCMQDKRKPFKYSIRRWAVTQWGGFLRFSVKLVVSSLLSVLFKKKKTKQKTGNSIILHFRWNLSFMVVSDRSNSYPLVTPFM